MRSLAIVLLLTALLAGTAAPVLAQDPPPRIGPFVIDGRGTVPLFKSEPQLAASRGLEISELPGRGLGVDAGAHVYLFTWKALTVGLGGQVSVARSRATPPTTSSLRPVTERLTSIAPQLSFNFGSGNGWSYLSGGIGAARLSIVSDGTPASADYPDRLRTFNYGGGARWFARPHLAFNVDFRFHQLEPGPPREFRPGTPRMTFIAIGAGVSVK